MPNSAVSQSKVDRQRGRGSMSRVEVVASGLYRINFKLPTSTNCWVYEDIDGLTLIDTANFWNARTIYSVIQGLAQPLKRIVITHAHPDHAGSAKELAERTGAQVYAHEADIPYLLRKAIMAQAAQEPGSRLLHQTAHYANALSPPLLNSVIPLKDEQYLGRLQIIHTPGHTPGSISLWIDELKALFIGDNASNTWNLHLNFSWFTLDYTTLASSLKKYAPLPARLLLPGHGPAYHSASATKDLLELLKK